MSKGLPCLSILLTTFNHMQNFWFWVEQRRDSSHLDFFFLFLPIRMLSPLTRMDDVPKLIWDVLVGRESIFWYWCELKIPHRRWTDILKCSHVKKGNDWSPYFVNFKNQNLQKLILAYSVLMLAFPTFLKLHLSRSSLRCSRASGRPVQEEARIYKPHVVTQRLDIINIFIFLLPLPLLAHTHFLSVKSSNWMMRNNLRPNLRHDRKVKNIILLVTKNTHFFFVMHTNFPFMISIVYEARLYRHTRVYLVMDDSKASPYNLHNEIPCYMLETDSISTDGRLSSSTCHLAKL